MTTAPRLTRWHENWDSGRYSVPGQGFHQECVHPYLAAFLPQLINKSHPNWDSAFVPEDSLVPEDPSFGVDKSIVLIPLCGKTTDMIFLAQQPYISALGLEAVPRAIHEFATMVTEANGVATTQFLHSKAQHTFCFANQEKTSSGLIGIVEGDALDFEFDIRQVDAIWDRGSVVALRPEDRSAYITMLGLALKIGGRVLLSVVEHDMVCVDTSDTAAAVPYGPPFSFSTKEVGALYKQGYMHIVAELAREDKLESEPRWKSKGATIFEEVCYLLEKKVVCCNDE